MKHFFTHLTILQQKAHQLATPCWFDLDFIESILSMNFLSMVCALKLPSTPLSKGAYLFIIDRGHQKKMKEIPRALKLAKNFNLHL